METALDLAITGISIAVVGFYAWSLRGHFSSASMPFTMRVVSAAVTLTTLLFLYLTWGRLQPAGAQLVGLGLEIAAALLFWWAISASRTARLRYAFDPDKPDSLVTVGPYRLVRHPFYTSYIIFWAGWAVATWTLWSILPVLAFVVIYVVAARGEEAKFAATPLAAEYAAYRRRTGFLVPKFAGA
ncbi:methyltransferase family protein [Mycoplana dimorpha]|uniref:Protein-S-isoprenylcysteine O-methyltransferase Ste14 n=1 Tax=Mycoplana dimorpha TaxID=28320 RepID=A0A2T5BBV4_MYCDI|nr:isoprenylcysteine carboxylmethyltransferase family protein [Mycoplana dimorpha]PTM96465.1 protein-S-isoprenylcysteine O-methyltransferase Ste14 [Mycoplana dimorpha]